MGSSKSKAKKEKEAHNDNSDDGDDEGSTAQAQKQQSHREVHHSGHFMLKPPRRTLHPQEELSGLGIISYLPNEILMEIVDQLSFDQIVNLSCASRPLFMLCSDDYVWKNRFDVIPPGFQENVDQNHCCWKKRTLVSFRKKFYYEGTANLISQLHHLEVVYTQTVEKINKDSHVWKESYARSMHFAALPLWMLAAPLWALLSWLLAKIVFLPYSISRFALSFVWSLGSSFTDGTTAVVGLIFLLIKALLIPIMGIVSIALFSLATFAFVGAIMTSSYHGFRILVKLVQNFISILANQFGLDYLDSNYAHRQARKMIPHLLEWKVKTHERLQHRLDEMRAMKRQFIEAEFSPSTSCRLS